MTAIFCECAKETISAPGSATQAQPAIEDATPTQDDAIDDATRPFGDAQEASLQTALAWLNGTLEKGPSEPVKRPRAPLGVAEFEASWGVTEQPPLNPDGSVRSF